MQATCVPLVTTRSKLPDWTQVNGKTVKVYQTLKDFPEGCIGFVYRILFDDNTLYIGKKSLYSLRTVKSEANRHKDAVVSIKFRNTGKGFRQRYDVIKLESNWKSYKGSSKEVKGRKPVERHILAFAFSKLELTYLEEKNLFKYDAIVDPSYINSNIGGRYYRGAIPQERFDGQEIRSES